MRRFIQIVENTQERFLFHGSKADFDHFDLDKIQNGMMGWGVYLTDDYDIAQDYARSPTGAGVVHRIRLPKNSRFLDITAPMWKQSEEVIQRLKDADLFPENEKTLGGHFYSSLVKQSGSPKGASQLLDRVGITGNVEGAGSWGVVFVVFDPRKLEIIK